MLNVCDEIKMAVIDGDEDLVVDRVNYALSQDLDPIEILNKGLIEGSNVVGQKFEEGEFFLPDLMVSGNAIKAGMEVINPKLKAVNFVVENKATIVIGTVSTDIHDIGKNIVSTMLISSGHDVIDLGVDVAPSRFIDEAVKNNADIIALSSLMITSRPYIKDTINLLRRSTPNTNIKVIIGGGAVNQEYCDSVGADGYSENAVKAVRLVETLMSNKEI